MVDPLLKTIPALQSLALVNYNLKKMKKKKTTSKDMLEMGVGNLVGVSLIKETADFIGD